jgi:hypothetical protein
MSAPVDPIRRATRSATDIAAELRREFDLALHARYGTQPKPDPVLATLFHSLAVQVARVYDEAATVLPVAVLDDLIGALDLPMRLAEPAQAVVAFENIEQRERITPETELLGYSRTGEQLGFTPDEAIDIAPVQLVFAAVLEGGRLTTLPGARRAGGELLPPASVPLPIAAPPTIFLAFDCDAAHLSEIGVFIDVLPDDERVARAIRRSPWQMLDQQGRVSSDGVLIARPGRGGVQRLRWFAESARASDADDDPVAKLVRIGEGLYGSRVWIFPPVPAWRRHLTMPPPAIAAFVPRLLPPDHRNALAKPFAWVQIPLPAGTSGVADAVQRVAVNCVAASNIEVWNEHIPFDRTGTVVTLRPEGNAQRHLMGVISVTGESGTPYVEDADVSAAIGFGRYRVRSGRLECRPARTSAGRYESYAMARLLYCDGERANAIDVGDIRRINSKLANVTAQVTSLTTTRGGSSPLAYADARLRFAELLRSRERVVTAADYEIAARAYEPRITAVDVTSATEMSGRGVELVDSVAVRVSRADFADPDAELVRLRDLLQRHLAQRCVIGHRIVVVVHADE